MDNNNIDSIKEEDGIFTLKNLLPMFLDNWKWFVLSVIICLGLAVVKLHYTPKVYLATTKVLIKDDDSNSRRHAKNALQGMENIGMITNSTGLDNEVEILSSPTVMEDVVRKLSLNIEYYIEGNVIDHTIYKNQPVNATLEMKVNDEDFKPIIIELTRANGKYHADVRYSCLKLSTQTIERYENSYDFNSLPYTINTKQGSVTLSVNQLPHFELGEKKEIIGVYSYNNTAVAYSNQVSVEPSSKMTTIADISYTDEHPRRATDFLAQLVKSYNSLANDDKNEIALRTEQFINGRLEKIEEELGDTENRLETYKRDNNVFELRQKAQMAMTQQTQYEQKLTDASTQIELLTGLRDYLKNPANHYEPMPFNVGISDQATIQLANRYNEAVIQRKRYLITSSESNPQVVAITAEANGLASALRTAVDRALQNAKTVYAAENAKYNQYAGQMQLTPSQERVLTQIGRQQEVRSDIYLLLLQKREENSISLASTADKGEMIYKPQLGGLVSPRRNMVLAIALAIGLAIPFAILILIQMLRYKISDREEVKKLTQVPIIAELATINETAKTKAEIVVHENSNNHSEEMFRQLRTNLLFTMREKENVILFTSSIPGEGKTFVASNLAISFALYGKRVLIVGLDIRKPRLADLFEINDHRIGISHLLMKDNPTPDEINSQIINSGVNDNLDLLMAGTIPPNPSELIGRESLDKIISYVSQKYDYVIIDSAPVGLVTDTLQAGRVADATVFVCRVNHTPKNCLNDLNELVKENKLPNVSLTVNGVIVSKRRYRRYGGYSYGYGYGYGGYGNEDDPTIK